MMDIFNRIRERGDLLFVVGGLFAIVAWLILIAIAVVSAFLILTEPSHTKVYALRLVAVVAGLVFVAFIMAQVGLRDIKGPKAS